MPMATRVPLSASKIAAPNGPPDPRVTFSRETAIARRILSSSVSYRRVKSTTECTHSGYSTWTTGALLLGMPDSVQHLVILQMTKTRIEAFSDGVIAILITIMVLELKVPHGAELGDLG